MTPRDAHRREARRLVTIPSLVLATALAVAVVPFACAVTAPFALRPRGRGRPIRCGIFLVIYLGAELVGIVRAFWLWLRRVASGRRSTDTRYQDGNRSLLSRHVQWLSASAATLFNVRVTSSSGLEALPAGSLLVVGRGGGLLESLLMLRELLAETDRRPQLVLGGWARYDPFLDVIAGRMVDGNATVFVPECSADVLAAIAASPSADVVVVAHTGLEGLEDTGDLWRAIPLTSPIVATWSVVSGGEVSAEARGR